MDVSWLRALGRPGWIVLVLVSLNSCGRNASKTEVDPSTPTVEERFRSASARLLGGFLENGWVVSRKPDGSPEHQGEGLIWTGLAMGALPCDLGTAVESTLLAMVQNQGGALIRIDPLGEYAGGREVTLDGAIGLYAGLAERVSRCGGADLWASAVRLHLDFLAAHGGRLHQNVDAKLLPHFDYLLDRLAFRLGVGALPDHERALRLEGEVATWAALVNAGHEACFRVHLGFLALQTIEALGEEVSAVGRWQFCAATRGMDIPTVDGWCGRGDLKGWIDSYQPNAFEFRFQRCGAWEAPDGDGDQTPGLDLLVAMRQAFSLSP